MWSYMTMMDVERFTAGEHLGIQCTVAPEMYPEFAEEDVVESYNIFYINTNKKTVKELDYNEANSFYKHVVGRSNRIQYWRVLRDFLKPEEVEGG